MLNLNIAFTRRHLDPDLQTIMKAADPEMEWSRIPFVLEAVGSLFVHCILWFAKF